MENPRKPKILVTGAAGQLGQSFERIMQYFGGFDFFFAGKFDFDITVKSREMKFLSRINPDAVINCAAYTNVEKAESNPEDAIMVNATAAGYLAEACRQAGCLLIHFSTDYVFDGKKNTPYTEQDVAHPLSVYGRSKLAGEKLIHDHSQDYMILRTSWLYSEFGHNFFRTMLRLAKEKGELSVVGDQVASPTYAGDLAWSVMEILTGHFYHGKKISSGLYHYSQDGEASWWDFASAIVKIAGIEVPVKKVTTQDFRMQAERPRYSKLANQKLKTASGIGIKSWQQGLEQCWKNYRKENGNG